MLSEKEMELIETKIELARAFAEEIQKLPRDAFRAIGDDIGYYSYRGVTVGGCPTRKHIDSDAAMSRAWQSVEGLPKYDRFDEVHIALRNDAWRLAQWTRFELV